jgi:Transglutaminase-like superfamily
MHKFFSLSATEKRLLVKSAFLLGAIRLWLWLLPFHTLRSLLDKRKRRNIEGQKTDRASINKVVWAIDKASHRIPAVTCLIRALAALLLLERLGYPACLRIGVAKGKEGQLEAHAWVESGGRVVIGDVADMSRYVALSSAREEVL